MCPHFRGKRLLGLSGVNVPMESYEGSRFSNHQDESMDKWLYDGMKIPNYPQDGLVMPSCFCHPARPASQMCFNMF